MRILIINPNSSQEMADQILQSAVAFTEDRYELACMPTPGTPDFIETYEDMDRAGPGMMKLLKENENDFDGFIVGCHYDPHLDTMKEMTAKPVVGIGQASMVMATMLGHRFSIVTTDDHSIPIHEALVQKYHLDGQLASVRAPSNEVSDLSEEEQFYTTSLEAVQQDMAEVIVLGCAGLSGLDLRLQNRLGVPVLDGVICALFMVEGWIKYGVSTSKIRRYHPYYPEKS